MPPLPFDKKLDVALIKQVQVNPIIYNTKHERYLELDRREVVWQKIGESLNRPAAMCKTRWINIRDNMRRKVRERQRPTYKKYNKTVNPSYRYRYEDELEFLIPFFKGCSPTDQGSGDDVVDDFINDDQVEQVFLDTDSFEIPESKHDISSLIVVNKDQEDPMLGYSKEIPSTSRHCPTTLSVTGSQDYVDPVNVFLDAVGSTLRNLNPYYLNLAKSKIFQVVQDCELQQIVNKGEQPPAT